MIDWDNLRVFLAAVHSGNYTAAAKRLRIDRTTVGRKLDRLEQQLGVRLFAQSEEGYHPTVAGRRALEVADQMEQLVDGLAAELGSPAGTQAGRLRIAVAAELGAELMADLAAFAASQSPPVQITIRSTADPAEHVVQRKSDIGLCLVDHRPDHLRGRRIARLDQAAYATRASVERHGADPRAQAWIRCSGWSQLPTMRRWDATLRDDVRVAAYVDSWPALLSTVELDVGAAFLWTFVADRRADLVQLAPPDASLGVDLWALVRDDVPMDRPTRAFMDDMTVRLAARIGQAA
ncbi:transcriptional regulator, LysR family [Sphingomonas laterariae]|uniref:Transcriptional regulator, LysR family n=1 Tax=Edaphosphingomonas laterariae TaxID=861865 RepID=A0A239BTU7_9SPHN|nr:LysR family transcriptional regulator [Sphingomonas laterariae]SNS11465.1 transcriptional regulator, LysR family [Sphingomonas laterariae]